MHKVVANSTETTSPQCSPEQQNILNNQTTTTPTTTSTNGKERQTTSIDIEFNLWTRPDSYQSCGALPDKKCKNLECNGSCGNLNHGNRTWFFFSVYGGEKNQYVKFNLLNLNKQAKLFSQGMHPVMKVGTNGKWERTKEKPTFQLTEDNFILSFCHRNNENVEDNLVFYAFTFPWTYREHLQALDSYDKKYRKSLEEINLLIREIYQPSKEKIVIDMHQTVNSSLSQESDKDRSQFSLTSDDANDGSILQDRFESFVLSGRSFSSSIDDNTSDSMQQLSSLVNNVKIEKSTECTMNSTTITTSSSTAVTAKTSVESIKNDIYYYRELLIHSLEQRRVDILTITSFEGIVQEREERLKNLFPDFSMPRCHKFRNKKIIFISSRVHPGLSILNKNSKSYK
jgi:hypothetical protein